MVQAFVANFLCNGWDGKSKITEEQLDSIWDGIHEASKLSGDFPVHSFLLLDSVIEDNLCR
jgi:hypothetical protein